MSTVPIYCPCGKALHTKHCLAELFGCGPRAVVRMAAQGRWPSTRVSVSAAPGQYCFTNEMIAQIISDGERWPQKQTANAPKPLAAKAVKTQAPARRTRQPQPAPNLGSNVRPLVAKGPRLGRPA